MDHRSSRRRFLLAAGITGIATTAGCTDLADVTNGDDDDHDDEMDHGDDHNDHDEPPELATTDEPEHVDINEHGNDITLSVEPRRHVLHGEETVGGPIELPLVWAFQANDGNASVPGPVLTVDQGTEFSITMENHDPTMHNHTFHLHALDRAWEDDGAPHMTGVSVGPEGTHEYEYTADVPGTHLYHCHVNTPLHMDMGMYGLLRVRPDDTSHLSDADREYFQTFREWDTEVSEFHAGMLGDMDHDDHGDDGMDHDDHDDDGMDHDDHDDDGMDHDDHDDDGMDHDDHDDDGMDHGDGMDHDDHDDGYDLQNRERNAFSINGKSSPSSIFEDMGGSPIIVEEGETIRLHWSNTGFTNHVMHSHSHRFRVVEKDGDPIPKERQQSMDTLDVGSAERYTVEFEADADPGIYPLHCHRTNHNQNSGEHMGGMLTAIVYESEMDSEIYEELRNPDDGDDGHDH